MTKTTKIESMKTIRQSKTELVITVDENDAKGIKNLDEIEIRNDQIKFQNAELEKRRKEAKFLFYPFVAGYILGDDKQFKEIFSSQYRIGSRCAKKNFKGVMINSARMTGVSTVMVWFAVWHAFANDNSDVLFVTIDTPNVNDVFDKVRSTLNEVCNASKDFCITHEKPDSCEVEFSNGSRIKVHTKTEGIVSPSLLIIDNFGFFENEKMASLFDKAVFLMNNCNTKVLLVSTPPKDNALYLDIYKCVRKDEKWETMCVDCTDSPLSKKRYFNILSAALPNYKQELYGKVDGFSYSDEDEDDGCISLESNFND